MSPLASYSPEPLTGSLPDLSVRDDSINHACTEAARATGGYPFLIQLVGRYTWQQNSRERVITSPDVVEAVAAARRRLGSLVYEPALANVSNVDRAFLVAMAQDSGNSKMSYICTRLGVNANYGSQYRLRLIEAGLVES